MKYSIKNKLKRKKNIQKKSIKKKGGAAYEIAESLLPKREVPRNKSKQNVTSEDRTDSITEENAKPKSLKKRKKVRYNEILKYNNNKPSSGCLPEWCLPACCRPGDRVNFGNNYSDCCEVGYKRSGKLNGEAWRQNQLKKISKQKSEIMKNIFEDVSEEFPDASVPLKKRISDSIFEGITTLDDVLFYRDMLKENLSDDLEEDIPKMIYTIVKGEQNIDEIIEAHTSRSNDNESTLDMNSPPGSVINNNLVEEDEEVQFAMNK